jgi:hypothetical protein
MSQTTLNQFAGCRGKSETSEPAPASLAPSGPLPAHPLADMLPIGTKAEMKSLEQNIKEHGLLDPIDLYQGKVLDGRRRQSCCLKAGVKPIYRDYTGGDPAAYVISKNLLNRELTASQKALIAYRLLSYFEEEAKQRQLAGKGADGSGGRGHKKAENPVMKMPQGFPDAENEGRTPKETQKGSAAPEPNETPTRTGRSRDQAAALVGVSSAYVQQIKLIARSAPAELAAIEQGEKTIRQVLKKLFPRPEERKPSQDEDKKLILELVRPLDGRKFDIAYVAREDLLGKYYIQRAMGSFLRFVLEVNGLFVMRSGLDEWVPLKLESVRLVTALVLETGLTTPKDAFNVDLRHELLLVYRTEQSSMTPPARIESLIRCGDPQELIESWFPAARKLRLALNCKREGWTTLSMLQPEEVATESKDTNGSAIDTRISGQAELASQLPERTAPTP